MARWRNCVDILRKRLPDTFDYLKEDFERTGNPVCAWRAMKHASSSRRPLPQWATDYFVSASDALDKLANDAQDGQSVRREAESVGKALGFRGHKPGQGGWLRQAALLDRDWMIHDEVCDLVMAGEKLHFAYEAVTEHHGIARSTVVKAFTRVEKFYTIEEGSTPDHT